MRYEELGPPSRLPEPGFYYHYKHDPAFLRADCPDAAIRNYAYIVLPSFGLYTEDDGPADKFRVNYLPLYPWAKVYQISLAVGRICTDDRPLSLFLSDAKTPSYSGPRFNRILVPDTITHLTGSYDEMWSQFPQ